MRDKYKKIKGLVIPALILYSITNLESGYFLVREMLERGLDIDPIIDKYFPSYI